MSGTRISQGMLSGLLLSAALLADEPANPPVAPAAPSGARSGVAQPGTSRTMRLHLMEGQLRDALVHADLGGQLRLPHVQLGSPLPDVAGLEHRRPPRHCSLSPTQTRSSPPEAVTASLPA